MAYIFRGSFNLQLFCRIPFTLALVGGAQILYPSDAALKGCKVEDGFFAKPLDILEKLLVLYRRIGVVCLVWQGL